MACQSVRLSAALGNPSIFLLAAMAAFSDKGSRTRILRVSAIEDRISIVTPIHDSGNEIRELLRGLGETGYVELSGRDQVMCTANGDCVKHTYHNLRVFLRLYRAYPPLGSETVEDVDKLREGMRRLCLGKSLQV
jgi:hypothetical protein